MSINTLTSTDIDASLDERIIAITYGQLSLLIKKATSEATEPLLRRVQSLEDRLDRVETLEGVNPAITAIGARLKLQEMRTDDIFDALEDIDNAVAKLQGVNATIKPGTKTAERIEQLAAILKNAGGTRSFKALQRDLNLKPNQFSALVSKLDKRRFSVMINPKAHDEKILRLRAFT